MDGGHALKVSTVKVFGRNIDREILGSICKVSLGFIFAVNIIGIPYILPFFRRYAGAPFLPSDKKAIERMLDNLPHNVFTGRQELSLVDFGSGDGRIVHAATQRGFKATGIELNPWLFALSNIKSLVNGGSFISGNMWTRGPSLLRDTRPDIVTIYGLPGEVLDKFGSFLEEHLPTDKNVLVVSNQFKIPKWGMRECGSVDGFIFYEKRASNL